MDAAKLAIIMVFAIPLAAIIGGILLAIIKVLKGGSSRANRELQAEETKLMQDIHQGLTKMDERVEALETLLIERDKKDADGEPKKPEG